MWNRLRYTVWAPAYDAIAGAAGFDQARRRSIERLELGVDQRVLIIGAGTGLDLPYLPSTVDVVAVDVTPAMLKRLQQRAAHTGHRAANSRANAAVSIASAPGAMAGLGGVALLPLTLTQHRR